MCVRQLSSEHLPRTFIYNRFQLLPGRCFTQWGLALYSHPSLYIPSPSCLWTIVSQPLWLCVDLCAHQGCELNYRPHYWDLSEIASWSWKGKKFVSGPSILPQNTGVSFHASTCPRKQANLCTLRLPLAWLTSSSVWEASYRVTAQWKDLAKDFSTSFPTYGAWTPFNV